MLEDDDLFAITPYSSKPYIKQRYEGCASVVFITNQNFVIKKPKNEWGLKGLVREDKLINCVLKYSSLKYFPHFSKKIKTQSGYIFIQEMMQGIPTINDTEEISKSSDNVQIIVAILTFLHSLDIEKLRKLGFAKRELWPSKNDLEEINTPDFIRNIFNKNEAWNNKESLVLSHFDFQSNNILHSNFHITSVIDFGNTAFFDRNLDFASLLLDFSLNFVQEVCDAYTKITGFKLDWEKISTLALHTALARDLAQNPTGGSFFYTNTVFKKLSSSHYNFKT